MNIRFEDQYKSINKFEWHDIPKFTVLTGKNGSGKSQLLELIYACINRDWQKNLLKKITPVVIEGIQVYQENALYLRHDWQLANLQTVSLHNVQHRRNRVYSLFQKRLKLYRTEYLRGVNLAKVQNKYQSNRLIDMYLDKIIIDEALYKLDSITLHEFDRFVNQNIVEDFVSQTNNKEIGNIFYSFYLNQIEEKLSHSIVKTPKTEAPWTVFNKLIKDLGLNYYMSTPEDLGLKFLYEPKLMKSDDGVEVSFNDLSSGEKVLMTLAFWIFHNKNINGFFPQLLILDEPDAHLHPTMSKKFVEVIEDVIVKKYNIRVIMSTHSPSTVAFSSEESLFLIDNKSNVLISKVSKDNALNVLTAGIPSFSVSYENRRQVFVESKNDVYYYEELYKLLLNHLEPEISLNFISAGETRKDKYGSEVNGCDQVISITNILRDAGNSLIWGIVDGDGKREQKDYNHIAVLGGSNRYAIENYILDPVLLSMFLVVNGISFHNKKFNKKEIKFSEFKEYHVDKIQNIVDSVQFDIKENFDCIIDETKVKCSYINGININIEKWYLEIEGHDLVKSIIKTYPGLNQYISKGEDKLLKKVINQILNEYPEFLSLDILNTFRFIQNIE